ncbi:hypothetical protein MOSE0_H02784 [Monosporozyma servazzii]
MSKSYFLNIVVILIQPIFSLYYHKVFIYIMTGIWRAVRKLARGETSGPFSVDILYTLPMRHRF